MPSRHLRGAREKKAHHTSNSATATSTTGSEVRLRFWKGQSDCACTQMTAPVANASMTIAGHQRIPFGSAEDVRWVGGLSMVTFPDRAVALIALVTQDAANRGGWRRQTIQRHTTGQY
jgi:hypothetical protein